MALGKFGKFDGVSASNVGKLTSLNSSNYYSYGTVSCQC